MIYNTRDPNSHYWWFLTGGKEGKWNPTQERLMMSRRGGERYDGYDGGGGNDY